MTSVSMVDWKMEPGLPVVPDLAGVGQGAVVADGDGLAGVLDHEGLGVHQQGGAGGGVAHVADGQVPGETGHLVRGEDLGAPGPGPGGRSPGSRRRRRCRRTPGPGAAGHRGRSRSAGPPRGGRRCRRCRTFPGAWKSRRRQAHCQDTMFDFCRNSWVLAGLDNFLGKRISIPT